MLFPLGQPIPFVVIFVILFLIGRCIFHLRKAHPTEIYVVWYAFSLFFVAFSFLGAYAWKNNTAVKDVFGQFAWVYDWATDIRAEVVMVVVFVGLVVLPQWVTYVLSGLSGSATLPKFVSQATDVAMWSLIKTVASLSGIALAGFFWASGRFELSRLVEAEFFLLVSFALLAYRYVYFWKAIDDLSRSLTIRFASFGEMFRHLAFAKAKDDLSRLRTFCRKVRDYRYSRPKLSSFRNVHDYFTKYSATASPTPTIVDRASSSASEALTTVTVQVLRDPGVKSAIVDQASSSAVEALTQVLRDPKVKSAIVDQTSSSAVEALTQVLRDPRVSSNAVEALTQILRDPRVKSAVVDQASSSAVEALTQAIDQATRRVFEALTTGTVQTLPDPRVISPNEGVEPTKT